MLSVGCGKKRFQSGTVGKLQSLVFMALVLTTSSISQLCVAAVGDEALFNVKGKAVQELSGPKIQKFAEEQLKKENPLPNMLYNGTVNLSDKAILAVQAGKWIEPSGFSEKAFRTMDVILREKGRIGVIHGEVGSGKSALMEYVAKRLVHGELPEKSTEFHAELKDLVLLDFSGAEFQPEGSWDMGVLIDTVKFVAAGTNLKLGLVIHNPQFIKPAQFARLADKIRQPDAIPVLIEANNRAYTTTVQAEEAINRYLVPIAIDAPSGDALKKILTSGPVKAIEDRTGVKLTEDVIRAAVDAGPDYRIDLGEPARTIHLLEDFAIEYSRSRQGDAKAKRRDVFMFVARKLSLPVLPQDEEAFVEYMNGVRGRIKARIVQQEDLVDGIVDQWIVALTSRTRRHQSAVLMGPTGVGKTLVTEVLMEEMYPEVRGKVLKIDMTAYKDAQTARNALFGATNGFVSAAENKGVICEYLDGVGKNGGVIALNEFEEASGPVQQILMELLDAGEVRGGDGRVRYLNRHLVIATSNKGTENLLSADRIRTMDTEQLRNFVKTQITEERLKEQWKQPSSFTADPSETVKAAMPERWDRFYFVPPLVGDSPVKVTKLEVKRWANDFAKGDRGSVVVDDSFAETFSSAFYDAALGARQLRTQVTKGLENAVSEFKKQHGYKNKELRVSARLHPSQKTVSYIKVLNPETGASIEVPGPSIPVDNPMLDAKFRNRVATLEEELTKVVYGQPEAIQALVGTITSRFLNWEEKKPATGFLAGGTGTGKTLLCKMIAKILFGDPTAVGLFELGKVKDVHDLGTIISPPPPFIGSDKPGQLEDFLIKYPDGGVIDFDEMGNAGRDAKSRAEIAKTFYTILDEGFYYSPATKKRYDLRKYVILFTGNDGEKIMQGANSDEAADQLYNEFTEDPKAMRRVLLDAGYPPAFVNRLMFVNLMRLSTRDAKILITEKALNEWRGGVSRVQPFDITFSEDFAAKVAELMFDPHRGGRSLSDFTAQVLGRGFGTQALKFDWDSLIEHGRRGHVELSLKVIKPTLPFYTGEKPDEKKAVLVVKATDGDQVIGESEIDFTHLSFFIPQVHANRARYTAGHEMGHAVASFTKITGKKVSRVTVVPEVLPDGRSSAGATWYKGEEKDTKDGWEFLVYNIAGLLAGSEAEILMGGDRSVGRSNDVERAGKMARQMILDAHLIPELDTAKAYLDNNGDLMKNLPNKEKQILVRYVDKALAEGRQIAIAKLKEDWPLVMAGTNLLMEYGFLTGHEYEALEARAMEAKARGDFANRDYQLDTTGIINRTAIGAPAPAQAAAASCADLLGGGNASARTVVE